MVGAGSMGAQIAHQAAPLGVEARLDDVSTGKGWYEYRESG
jgi:3-hydroxyacyl-CoA dehydrogenase